MIIHIYIYTQRLGSRFRFRSGDLASSDTVLSNLVLRIQEIMLSKKQINDHLKARAIRWCIALPLRRDHEKMTCGSVPKKLWAKPLLRAAMRLANWPVAS